MPKAAPETTSRGFAKAPAAVVRRAETMLVRVTAGSGSTSCSQTAVARPLGSTATRGLKVAAAGSDTWSTVPCAGQAPPAGRRIAWMPLPERAQTTVMLPAWSIAASFGAALKPAAESAAPPPQTPVAGLRVMARVTRSSDAAGPVSRE
ncbi:MAG: hypothetical protein MUE51_00220 [Thermoleophilia bacterium]|nr:hypothetical protein [Thermoleophilia bacterium]